MLVNMVLPRINTEGQPELPSLFVKPGILFCGLMRGWGGRWESNLADLKTNDLFRARVKPNAPTEHIWAVNVPQSYPDSSKILGPHSRAAFANNCNRPRNPNTDLECQIGRR
jgi:hypothetical protein